MGNVIDAVGLHYRKVNNLLRAAAEEEKEIILKNINGQRYIGAGVIGDYRLTIEGTPGNDLAAYMQGPEIRVKGNVQDAACNTMNTGTVVVEGDAGDIVGYAMRGGELFVKGNIGYRVGIHMKEYKDKIPVIVIGGRTGDFFAEYMAGGIMIVLGLDSGENDEIVGNYCGTGMHGGVIYVCGEVSPHKLGKEVDYVQMEDSDYEVVKKYVERYCGYFNVSPEKISLKKFHKLIPYNKRPYGSLYAPH